MARSRGLNEETRIKEVNFQIFPEGSDRGVISYLEDSKEQVHNYRGN